MFLKKLLNYVFYRALCSLFSWRVKYKEYRTKKKKPLSSNPNHLLILTSQPESTLKSAIWEQIQTQWKWDNYESVTIKQISPALPFKVDTDPHVPRFIKRFYYLRRKFLLSFFIIWQVGHYNGIILETLFSYKGELFLEELFLGCFQKTVLDVGQIQLEIQKLNNQAKYDLDLSALEKKIHRIQAYSSLSLES